MKPRELLKGDVVQLGPGHGCFSYCLMLVTEPKEWGAQGFISVPGDLHDEGPRRTYFRCEWPGMEFVGKADYLPSEHADAE